MTEPAWTEEEERIFRHEALVAKVIELRDAGNQAPKPSFVRLLESNTVAAIVTILLGSLLTPIVISSIQHARARDDQALTEYKQYLQRQQEVVTSTYDLVGRVVAATQDLISLTLPHFDSKSTDAPQKLAEQTAQIKTVYNTSTKEWEVEEEKVGLLISYYHYGQPDVLPAWRETQESVNHFIKCAEERYQRYWDDPEEKSKPDPCQGDRAVIRESLNKLSATIESSRRQVWQQFDVPAPRYSSVKRSASASPEATPTPFPSTTP